MKKLLVLAFLSTCLSTSLMANTSNVRTFNCTSIDQNKDPIKVAVDIYTRDQVASINLQIGDQVYSDISKLGYFSGNNMGLSRCPGWWGGISFTSTTNSTPFNELSIITDTHFDCGGPDISDILTLKYNGKNEKINLNCTEL